MKLHVSLEQVKQLSTKQRDHLASILKKRGFPMLYAADKSPHPAFLQIDAATLHNILSEFDEGHDVNDYTEKNYVDLMWEKLKKYL